MKKAIRIIWPLLKNKYALTIAGFAVWIIFFSQYSLMDQRKLSREMRQLEQEKVYYKEQIWRDSTRLYELTTNVKNLEKYAREQYYMKKTNEDIFVVIEE
ncbi:septum formation initiator family protein [Bacteroidota bacterium]